MIATNGKEFSWKDKFEKRYSKNERDMMMRGFILCMQLLCSVRGAAAALCPDGGAALTQALYAAGNPAAYQNVTCIPDREFRSTYKGKGWVGYTGDVALSGLPFLKSIGKEAFDRFKGKIFNTYRYL